MTELKCPKCGETEEIYYAFDALERGHGIKCYRCEYEIGGCESAEEAEFKWKSENDPMALRSCPFCDSKDIQAFDIGETFVIYCNDCYATGPEADTLEGAVEKWNKRVKE